MNESIHKNAPVGHHTANKTWSVSTGKKSIHVSIIHLFEHSIWFENNTEGLCESDSENSSHSSLQCQAESTVEANEKLT